MLAIRLLTNNKVMKFLEIAKTIKLIVSVITLTVMMISFSSCSSNDFEYQKNIQESFVEAKNIDYLSVDKLAEIVLSSDTMNFQFVDLRTPHQYLNGHILNAISKPFKSLYGDECETFCNTEKVFLLYGNDASQAGLAFTYLKKLGVENIIAVGGGYDFINDNIIENFGIHTGTYNDEIAKYDFAQIVAETSGGSVGGSDNSSAPPPVIPVQRKNDGGNVGGCE